MVAVSDAEDYEVLGGIAVVVVIVNHARFDVIDSEHEALSTWILHETNKNRNQILMCVDINKIISILLTN